ncbi:MAG: PD-(D/E)XK nuclease family protein [Deltaproteobacteria bacterium]|nr:PD-(D/E)XK nuclease family protein [Deltaproteobacteria bacterium]
MKKELLDILFKEQSLGAKEQRENGPEKDISPLKPHAPPINNEAPLYSFSHQWTYTRFIDAQYGDIYHALLARIKTISENLSEDLKKICSELLALQDTPYNTEDIVKTLTDFLHAEPVSIFFKPAAEAESFNEKEFSDKDGNLVRMDRVIVMPKEIWVVDFKSGTESGDYGAQIKNYMKILTELYPNRTIKGFLAYIKEAKVEQVV